MNGALFGFGRAGRIHYKNMISNPTVNLKYIYEIKEKVRSIKHEIEELEETLKNTSDKTPIVTSSLETILNDVLVDFCIICTPTNYHHALIMEALENNKHVLCEKPISIIKEEIEECYKLADSKNLVLLCALNRRFDPKIMQLKEDMEKIGKIHQITTISRDYPYPTLDYLRISSGLFADCGVHDIDYVNWLLDDKPINVYVTGKKIQPNDIGAGELDNAVIIMEYANKTIATLNLSRISTNYDQRIEVYGSNGYLHVDNPYLNDPIADEHPISFPERYAESYKNELTHFLNVIQQKELPKIKMEDCLNCLNIVKACETSFNEDKKITIKYTYNFRNYNEKIAKAIKNTYYLARTHQTVKYVEKMQEKYSKFDISMNICDIFKKLETFIDISDPDISLPNYYHGLQTAEQIRKDGHPEWLQVVGLIHDIGKIMYLKGCDEDGTSIEKQWGIVGDTFIVGCAIPDEIVYPEFNGKNPDMLDKRYNTRLGIYQENCGLENIMCTWGHDEYLYSILKHNCIELPEEAFYIIRYHSLYTYHTYGGYDYLTNDYDKKMFKWLKLFNKYDLYTKSDDNTTDYDKNYYNKLISKYIGDENLWI
jgi:inositol oxygenase